MMRAVEPCAPALSHATPVGPSPRYFLPYATGQIFSSLIFNLFMSKIQRRLSFYAVFEQIIYGVTSSPPGADEAWHTQGPQPEGY